MLEDIPYVPLLHTRLAEMSAVAELPDSTKNRMLPLLVSRPWLNSQSLDKLWDRVQSSLGNRQFGLDLDFSRRRIGSDHPAYQEFNALFDPNDGYSNYFQLLDRLEFAVPTLRYEGDSFLAIEQQFERIDALGRGVIIRLTYGSQVSVRPVLNYLGFHPQENVVFYVDAGWNRDLLGRDLWAIGVVRQILDHDPNAEIVVSASSFPNAFGGRGFRCPYSLNERALFNETNLRTNAPNIRYGDWGSTRPPADPVPMKNIPRIDISRALEWVSFRETEDVSGYRAIAMRVIEDQEWPDSLDIWGTYMIRCTAEGLPSAIRSPASAAAARVNMHLHVQAHFDDADGLFNTEDDFEDIVG